MIYFWLLIMELIILFFLSRKVVNIIGSAVFFLTKSKKASCYFLAFIFLPGTAIHELSHFIFASILFVRTGELSLWPEVEDDGFKLGSLQIEKTDQLRRLIIGISPIICGFFVIVALIYSIYKLNYYSNPFVIIIAGIFLFVVSNTMFSSRQDLDGALALVILLLIIFLLILIWGVSINFYINADPLINFLKLSSEFMLIPLGINLGLVGISKLL